MIKSGFETSEGKKSLGILVGIGFFIYYVLSHRYGSMPDISQIIAHAESATDIAKAYAAASGQTNTTSSTINGAFDIGALIVLITGMYKTFSNYSSGRIELKKEEARTETINNNSTALQSELQELIGALKLQAAKESDASDDPKDTKS